MSVEDWEKAANVMNELLKQAYYRILSFISFHFGVEDAYLAAQWLAENVRGGQVYWVVEGKIARWDNIEVFPSIFMNIWFFGGNKNTVMARRGWWALYLLEVYVKALSSQRFFRDQVLTYPAV